MPSPSAKIPQRGGVFHVVAKHVHYVEEVGTDVVRAYLMFMGPWEAGGEWNDDGINGMARWTNRAWALCLRDAAELDAAPPDEAAARDTRRTLHKTIRKVTDEIERFKFNTAIAAMMELSNALGEAWSAKGIDSALWRECLSHLALLMAPVTPFLAEEMWETLGNEYSVHLQPWPKWDAALAADEIITLVVQVNGRLRDRIQVPADISEDAARALALSSPRTKAHTEGKTVRRVIYVPGRLVNVVAG